MKRKVSVLATHQLPAESRGGDEDAVADAMLIGWVGGSYPARSDCQTQQDSGNDDEPAKFKGSVLKLELPTILLLIYR